jgi:hypothetical protein
MDGLYREAPGMYRPFISVLTIDIAISLNISVTCGRHERPQAIDTQALAPGCSARIDRI